MFYLKRRLILTYFIVSVCLWTNILHILGVHILESKRFYNVIPSVHYFHVKTKMVADFQICISVPLNKVIWLFIITRPACDKEKIVFNSSFLSFSKYIFKLSSFKLSLGYPYVLKYFSLFILIKVTLIIKRKECRWTVPNRMSH